MGRHAYLIAVPVIDYYIRLLRRAVILKLVIRKLYSIKIGKLKSRGYINRHIHRNTVRKIALTRKGHGIYIIKYIIVTVEIARLYSRCSRVIGTIAKRAVIKRNSRRCRNRRCRRIYRSATRRKRASHTGNRKRYYLVFESLCISRIYAKSSHGDGCGTDIGMIRAIR